MSIRHGVYIQEEATAVQVPKTGNSSVQVVVGTAPVNMAENPSEAVNVPILANSGTEAMAALGYSVDFKNFTLCQTMFATSNLFQVSPVVYINVLDPAKHNKELAEAEYQVCLLYTSYTMMARGFYNPEASFPAILDQTIEKAYKEGYRKVAVTFDKFTKKGSLKDFKKHDNYYVAGPCLLYTSRCV